MKKAKTYTAKIEGVTVKYKLMTRGLKRKLKAKGIPLSALNAGDTKKADDIMDFILDECILNPEDCDEISYPGGDAQILKAIISSSNNIGEKAEKN